MRFKLLSGTMDWGKNKYKAGDVIESDADLREMFVNKFALVEQAQPAPAKNETPPIPAPVTAVKAEPAPTAVQEEKGPEIGLPGGDVATDRGRDCTKNFALAVDQDYLVFKTKGGYFVYDSDKPATPINSKGAAKADVPKIIKKHLEK